MADGDVETAANRVKEGGRMIARERNGRLLPRDLGWKRIYGGEKRVERQVHGWWVLRSQERVGRGWGHTLNASSGSRAFRGSLFWLLCDPSEKGDLRLRDGYKAFMPQYLWHSLCLHHPLWHPTTILLTPMILYYGPKGSLTSSRCLYLRYQRPHHGI